MAAGKNNLAGRKLHGATDELVCNESRKGAYRYRPSALVTSTIFDNDDVFSAVAKALLFQHETEGYSEEDAIKSTLLTSEEQRAFLESLDLRNATMYLHQDEELNDLTPVNELVKQARFIFGKTLQSLWRDSMVRSEISSVEDSSTLVSDEIHEYHRPLKTPKNLHSPIITTTTSSSSTKSPSSSNKLSQKRRRRSFFPDPCDQARGRARMRIDFNFSKGAKQVKTLTLEGFSNPQSISSYIPPSSPINILP